MEGSKSETSRENDTRKALITTSGTNDSRPKGLTACSVRTYAGYGFELCYGFLSY
jgi:hypothetical protein